MQIRCSYCQIVFATSRQADLAALQRMESEGLNHYDAHCPRCRRANAVDRTRLEKAYPNWRQEIQETLKAEAKQEEQE